MWNLCRWSDGLHQAIEAKEGVEINNETVTLASISYQNFFRAYPKLSGMSGTASTEIDEFSNIYNMSVQARSFLLQCIHTTNKCCVCCGEFLADDMEHSALRSTPFEMTPISEPC